MSKRKTYHVTPNEDGGWKVKAEDTIRASGTYETKPDAVARATELAKRQDLGQVVIHKKDGTIQTEHTYGNDPYPPEG